LYEHNASGRIQRQVITPADPLAKVSTTRWSYHRQQLTAVEHPEQSERYHYDPGGRLASRAITIKAVDGTQRTGITRYAYDDDGQLRRSSLPDGSWLRVQRNGQGQVVGLVRDRIGTAWLGWLLPAQTIVSDIERDLVGPRRFVTGNGVETRFQRSREGVLARVLHGPLHGPTKSGVESVLDKLPLPGAHAASSPLRDAHAASSPLPTARPGALPGALGLPADPTALLDYRYLWDTRRNLLHTQGKASGGAPDTGYAWDGRDRLIAAANANDVSRFLYDRQGNRLLSQQGIKDQHDLTAGTVRPTWRTGSNQWVAEGVVHADWDASGQPEQIGTRRYRWDALGKLVEVRQERQPTVHYAYNHRGERIRKDDGTHGSSYLYEHGKLSAELDEHGRITRQYLYLADQPIAVLDTFKGVLPDGEERSVLAQITADIAVAFHAWFNNDEQLAFLHANHLGAIEVATAADGKVIWRAQYGPFGQVLRISAFASPSSGNRQFRLRLRLPGQYEDEETGLYYNGQRYYDPQRGRYLTSDPLGTPDGPNGYAYVRGNPLKYVDPNGLILFAFDGTGNDESDSAMVSNVVKFRDRYLSDSGEVDYITGVGTLFRDRRFGDIKLAALLGGNTVDAGANYTGPARIDRMVTYFNQDADNADDETTMEVDIIGFSRGAAEARDFSNRLVKGLSNGYYNYKGTKGEAECQKVDFRFLGLWDTVLSTNLSGYDYQLAIPEQFLYVAQAVALNEYRGTGFLYRPPGSIGAFPLESIMQGMLSAEPLSGKTRIERGFIGSHSDIGGGFDQGDLSNVALAWMIAQARSAGVALNDAPETIIADPVLHDKSNAMRYGPPGANSEDRAVRYRNGSNTTQRNMPVSAGMAYDDTPNFITYGLRYGEDDVTGTVDAKAYLEWLNANGYGLQLEVTP
jgi:RHS repeat-associated protein